MTERQVIVTWYTPEEKLPEEDLFTIVTISGKIFNTTYDHAFAIATYSKTRDGYLTTCSSTSEAVG